MGLGAGVLALIQYYNIISCISALGAKTINRCRVRKEKKLAKAAYKNVGFPAMFADPIKSIRGIESVENTFWKKSPGNLDDVEQQQ